MALTTCPECGKERSSTASACPHCGHEARPGLLGKSGTLSGTANVGCAGCLVLIVGLVLLVTC